MILPDLLTVLRDVPPARAIRPQAPSAADAGRSGRLEPLADAPSDTERVAVACSADGTGAGEIAGWPIGGSSEPEIIPIVASSLLSAEPSRFLYNITDGNYQVLRGGEPYTIRGAGASGIDLASLARQGGNSIRTWSADNATQMLDSAHELGITVALCLYAKPERSGFDYDDEAAVKEQFGRIKAEVLMYKDHPALLFWIIGNELNHDYTNSAVYDAVNDISEMIHALDPYHPTTTTLAGFSTEMLADVNDRAPDLDFVSIQVYGMLVDLPRLINDSGFTGPFAVTESGARGHWEVDKTSWQAPLEQNSSEKAATFLRGHTEVIQSFGNQSLGDYVFLWGQKQEKTPTWYGMFLEDGEQTEVVDVMHYIWNGAWPENRTPRIESVLLDGKSADNSIELTAGELYKAELAIDDPDYDSLRFQWEVKRETTAKQVGGDHEEAIPSLPGIIKNPADSKIELAVPGEPGAYRLFVYAYDGQNNAGHANIPFYVKGSN